MARATSGPALHIPLLLLLAAVVRVPFWVEALRTPLDGDAAIIGLMARHPARAATMWGQPYGSPVEPWLAAPIVAAAGLRPEAVRFLYFALGLALVPLAYALARALDPRAGLPAGVLAACPPAYFLLLAALPPPMYPAALALAAALLVVTVALGDAVASGRRPVARLAVWGGVAGLALWTHLMTVTVVLAGACYLAARARPRRSVVLLALPGLLLASLPWWGRALVDPLAFRVVAPSDRRQSWDEHLRETLPALHLPVGAVLGTHVPLVADDPEHVVRAPGWAAASVVLFYGVGLILAGRAIGRRPEALLLLGAAALALAAFPLPARAGPHTVRFLTPLYLPVATLLCWAAVSRASVRRAWILVLALASLHLLTGSRLLAAWRAADRAAPPFLLPDLAPVLRRLEAEGIRRGYASYGPAYRLTFESGERVVVSQPWNERFLHHPLPYLDEVRFAKNVAWVLTPGVPSDLPSPRDFEEQLGRAGGAWRRTAAGPAALYHAFEPPFAPLVRPFAPAGPAGDARLETAAAPATDAPITFALDVPRALDALTLVAPLDGPRLLRSMDVEVSADGSAFEVVAQRRRRGEREDLRWVNGHPQYVIDHDLLSVPLAGRTVAAVRVRPVSSGDAWGLAELLLHPATPEAERRPWDEWLDPNLDWAARRRRLVAEPRPDREDWYYRMLLAARAR